MKKLTKRVQAGGLWFDVPPGSEYLSLDSFGTVKSHTQKPSNVGMESWLSPGVDDFVCYADIDDADWRECCWYVGDQADSKPKEQPVAWMAIYHGEVHDDAIGLTQAAVVPQTKRFGWESSLTEIIPLYRNPPPEQMQRREWLARGVELAIIKLKGLGDKSYSPYELECLSNYIRAGEVE